MKVGISTPPQLLQFKLADLLICPVGFTLLSGALWEDTKLLQLRCCVGRQELFFKIIVGFVVACEG